MKYGEIIRFKYENILYVLHSSKIQSSNLISDPFLPFLSFRRSNKTSKKKYSKNLTKDEKAHCLDKTFNLVLINKIINHFDDYLKKEVPKYVSFEAYGDTNEAEKRNRIYKIVLNKLGYNFIGVDPEYECYYFERRREE